MAKKKGARKLMTPSAIAKKYGSTKAITLDVESPLRLPTKNIAFNHLIGGGIPYGSIMEIFGEESGGKTLMAYDFADCAQKLGGMVIWVDSEHAFKGYWSKLQGLDLEKVELYQETAIERVSDFIADICMYYRSILTNNEPILLVTDSIASLDTLENKNSSHEDAKAEMGTRAKHMDIMLRKRNELLYDLGVCSIFINQLRSKIGASKFEDPDTTPGGKAMKYYASIRVGFYGGKRIEGTINGEKEIVGRQVSIRVKKNKTAPIRSTLKAVKVFFNPDYDSEPIGFDKYHNLPNLLVRCGAIERKKGGSIYKDLDGNVLARGEEKMLKLLKKDHKLRRKLIKLAGINTISQTRKNIESYSKNLFPLPDTKISRHDEDEEDLDN